MESTVSVSKGVFLFPNGNKKLGNTKKKKPLFDKLFTKQQWYITYKRIWDVIENEVKDLHNKTYSMLLTDIVSYIKSFDEGDESRLNGVVPSATLLTGVNQPDHVSQFTALIQKIRDDVTPHIAMISSQDAPSLKNLVENTVWQLIYGHQALDVSIEEEDMPENKKLRKNQCTMRTLQKWYTDKYKTLSPRKRKRDSRKKSLVVIIQDFESFNCEVLQDFVMIVSSYMTSLPIVFVFGVATSVSALHKSFPYHVSSKLLIKVFHSHSSPVYMNQVLENIFLTHEAPVHLSGKALELLTDVFLFYDFSVTGLIQSIKYCMMDHYYGDNTKTLCCERERIEEAILKLTSEDLESIRQLLSFRPFLEAQDSQTQIKLFEDDGYFKEVLNKELNKFHDYLHSFYMCVRVLTSLVKDLPRSPLGKQIREVYTKCTLDLVTDNAAFKESMLLLGFQSQVKLVDSIKSALKVINSSLQNISPMKPLRSTPTKNNLNNIRLNNDLGENFIKSVRVHLTIFLRQIENANTESIVLTNSHEDEDANTENVPGNRYKLKEKLLQSTRVERIQSEFEMIRSRFISYLEDMFSKGLQPPQSQPFHEILVFSEVAAVKKQIVGAPRGALHTALSNPQYYLQCLCCHHTSSESMSDTLPDLSIAYKLHRECGKHINLYDWLQAFAAVLRPQGEGGERGERGDDDHAHLDAQVQSRFSRAVAELQFLGFIKTSKRKTDHVMRLTW